MDPRETNGSTEWYSLERLAQDLRYGLRVLRRRPVYAVLSVLTLAFGVGGIASVYGVAQGVVLGPLPYAHEREVGIFWMKTDWTEEEYLYVRGRVPGFRQVAMYRQRDVILRDGQGAARLVPGVSASSELFEVLGAAALVGRGLQAGDDVPGAEAVAFLSFGLWQELGGDPSIVGRRVTLDGTPRTIVGVMPRGFWFPNPSVRIWTPEPLTPARNWNSTLIGRVAPGQDVHAMDAPMAQLAAMLDERFDYTARRDKTKDRQITPIRDDLLGFMQPAVFATLGATILILLIGCANVAALVLGQVDARSGELAVRSALGASRLRLAQQLVIEVLILAIVAGTVGAGLARAGFALVTDALPLGAWAGAVAPDWRVFAAAMGVAVGASLLVMLVPVISLYRGDQRSVLHAARLGGVRRRGGRLENGLVVAQVALAVVIAAGAALLARSVANMYAVEPGVETDGVAVVDLVFEGTRDRARREQVLTELSAALAALPGVRSVGMAQTLPLRGGGYRAGLGVDDRPELKDEATEYRVVTPGYLETVGIRLREGRTIAVSDRRDSERVVVVNEAFVLKYFGGASPLGRLIGGDANQRSRIVGVVANAAERHLTDAPAPVRYVAVEQIPWLDDAQTLVLRAAPGIGEATLLEPARLAIARLAPDAAVQETTTMRRVLDAAVGPARQVVLLLSLLTGLAMLLGAVGVYGVIAHFASRRRRDWAIRVAIGMPGSRVIAHVLGHGALLVAAGIAIGIAGAAMLTRLLSSFLYGVTELDPLAFAAAAAALLCVGLIAAIVPAVRAGMADPLTALREQ